MPFLIYLFYLHMFNFYFFSLIGCHEVLFFFRQDIAFASALDELYNNDFLYGFDFKRQTKFYMAKFFNIGYKNIWKLMYRSRNERLKFSGVEDETLLSIICQFQESKDSLCFKKIMNMFNSQMKKKVKSHPKRKVQVLRDR